ncbi:Pfam:DUF3468 [Geosmithia morbida]|uniref:Pfam:DUF3468 n=1 Tax=Geosmithia morbida TaxID=1094350 RepID=A0A9P5CZT1_9HYPO|nr:Pfam:DUF3468 [Geosmithia morbida]KAF4120857.1 Pfam:DUF3468 [Geosmithia morbida]
MPFFIDYYTNTLCPGMVLVDGPGNPFRRQIMQLAAESPSLQHAICALSACNLRMRTKLSLGQDPRELSAELRAERKAAAESAAASSDGQDAQALDERTPLSEESEHRNLAIRLLNRQLNDPAKSSDDSTLATILLLSHCRMAESGIAKFHTQFAGVKRIMAIRSSRQMTRREPSWMEAVFAHFDAISASVNDREAQLSVPLAQLAGGDNMLPAGVENLIGCDGELFKTISRLGRLNLLSQHRPVQVRGMAPAEAAPSQAADVHAHGRLDGNGSGSSPDEADVVASATRYAGVYDVRRSAFWKEWKEIREALRRWKFDGETVSANLPEAPTPKQVRDLGSVSEAFRHAALLYTERLSSPMLPSSHSNFQNLVSQVIRYTTSLEAGSSAEKFLLWPLFVAGSECVDELQQSIVRSKCRGMMARSGYMNNLAALQVLEELWATELKGEDARVRTVGRRSPFNWSRYISGGDVEWIMF